METPKNIEDYSDNYSPEKLMDKLKRFGKKAGVKVVYLALLLYYVLTADTVSKEDKLKILGALGYLILPIDLIPDAIPVLGFSDDLAALLWAYHCVKMNVTPEMTERAKNQLTEWFGVIDEGDLELL